MFVECIVDTGYQSWPLHRVCLKPQCVTRDVEVGTVDKIPVEGVHMPLGNDPAGEHVSYATV